MEKDKAIALGGELVDEQRGVAAVIATSAWCAPIMLAWYLLAGFYPDAAGVFILFGGFLIGYSFAFHGRAVTRPFQLAAAVSYLTLIYFSSTTGLLFYGDTSLVSIIVMFLAGIVTAVAMARRSLTDKEKAAMWRYGIEYRKGRRPWSISYSFLLGGALSGSAMVCALTAFAMGSMGME